MASPRARNPGNFIERYRMPFDFPSVTVDTTTKIHGIKGRSVRIDRVWLSLPAGQTSNASNFVIFKVIKNASTIIASWSTSTTATGQGTITANTPVDLAITTTVADRYLADTDVLSLFVDTTGTITVPAGRIVAEGLEL